MPGPTTQVLNEDLKALREEVHKIATGLTELRTEVKILTGIARWGVGVVLSLTLIGLSSIGAGIWWASGIDSNVKRLDARVEQIQSTLDHHEAALKSDIKQIVPGVREAIHEEVKTTPASVPK